jgi:hypothetical protein
MNEGAHDLPAGDRGRGEGASIDPARLAAARREVETFARTKGAAVIEDGPGRWRVERKPTLFKLGIYRWAAELQADGGLVFSEREWRPDPKYE